MIELHITAEGIERTDYNWKGETKYHIKYPDLDNIPDGIKTKLSALKLMHAHTDVESIGQKVSDTIYWIYDEDQPDPGIFRIILMMSKALKEQVTLKQAWRMVMDVW